MYLKGKYREGFGIWTIRKCARKCWTLGLWDPGPSTLSRNPSIQRKISFVAIDTLFRCISQKPCQHNIFVAKKLRPALSASFFRHMLRFMSVYCSAASSVALDHCVLNSLLMHCASKEILGEDIASFVKANLFFVNWLLTEVKRQLQSP